jgi:hypothetical protein
MPEQDPVARLHPVALEARERLLVALQVLLVALAAREHEVAVIAVHLDLAAARRRDRLGVGQRLQDEDIARGLRIVRVAFGEEHAGAVARTP